MINKYDFIIQEVTPVEYKVKGVLNKIDSPAKVYKFYEGINYNILTNERFSMLMLDNQNNIIGLADLAMGTTKTCNVSLRDIVQRCLQCNASGIILVHNHPSGTLKPSGADINVTKHLVEHLQLFDITILDHIILTKDTYTSLKEKGLI